MYYMHENPFNTLLSGDHFTPFPASAQTDRFPVDLIIDRPIPVPA